MKSYKFHTCPVVYEVSIEVELDYDSEITFEMINEKLENLKSGWNFVKEAEGVCQWWTTSEGEYYSEPQTYWDPGYEEEDLEFTKEEFDETVKDIKSYYGVEYVSTSFEEKRGINDDRY